MPPRADPGQARCKRYAYDPLRREPKGEPEARAVQRRGLQAMKNLRAFRLRRFWLLLLLPAAFALDLAAKASPILPNGTP